MSADTVVPGFANPQSLNRYSYVYNNPLGYTDPSGHCGNGSGNIRAEIVSTVCKQLLKYREDIFFPDENTTGWDRAEASYVVGVLSVTFAFIATVGYIPGGGNPTLESDRPGYFGPEEGWPNQIEDAGGYSQPKAPTLQEMLDNKNYQENPGKVIFPAEGDKRAHMADTTKYHYIIDESGNVRVARATDERYPHHSHLNQGENVYGAGEMFVDPDGTVRQVNDQSGHYRPNQDQFYPYLKDIFKEHGFTVPDNVFK